MNTVVVKFYNSVMTVNAVNHLGFSVCIYISFSRSLLDEAIYNAFALTVRAC